MAATADLIPSLPLDIALDCLQRLPLSSLATISQVCTSWKALVSSPAFYLARHAKGYADSHACIIQAPSCPGKAHAYEICVLDEKQRRWEHLPPAPDLPHGLPLFCACAAVGSQIVLLGGWDPSLWSVLTSVYIYDFITSRWRCGSSMPTARSFFACAAVGHKVVVAGGHDQDKNAMRTAEMYDVGRDVWEALPDMLLERDECKAVCIDGKLMVVSGFSTDSQGQFMASAEQLDPVAGKWEMVEDFWPPGRPPCPVVPFQGQLYAVLDGHLACLHKKVWQPVLALPAAAVKLAVCATPLSDGILIVGIGAGDGSLNAIRCCRRVGTGSRAWIWRAMGGNALKGTVQQAACTIQI